MENDAEAALAASMAYESLDGAGRDTWLDALDEDLRRVDVSAVAIYAPLLSVEEDESRLTRIRLAIGVGLAPEQPHVRPVARALRGVSVSGDRVVVVVLPLYLAFVQIVACRFHPQQGFRWATHEAIARNADAPRAGTETDGVSLERTPMKPVIEELAHAVLAQRRQNLPLPEELKLLLDLFTPSLDEEETLAGRARARWEPGPALPAQKSGTSRGKPRDAGLTPPGVGGTAAPCSERDLACRRFWAP